MSKGNKVSERSKCCGAKVKVVGRTTLHYECLKCKEPCDVYYKERKTWGINPQTKIVPNKKRLFTDKEIKKFLKEEDF